MQRHEHFEKVCTSQEKSQFKPLIIYEYSKGYNLLFWKYSHTKVTFGWFRGLSAKHVSACIYCEHVSLDFTDVSAAFTMAAAVVTYST